LIYLWYFCMSVFGTCTAFGHVLVYFRHLYLCSYISGTCALTGIVVSYPCNCVICVNMWENISDLGVQPRADISDDLLEEIDHHISNMFHGEMHNYVSFLLCFLIFNYFVIINCNLNCVLFLHSKLKWMWKTFSLPQWTK
jgi:hypothetical protein